VMEPTLLRLLTRLGIHFDPIGPVIDYHGRRQPCFIPLETLLPRVKRERPDVWGVITRGGQHWANLCQRGAKPGTTPVNASPADIPSGRG
jgi:N-acyl amino acid synthase of PEP-CTERM/exosortase system